MMKINQLIGKIIKEKGYSESDFLIIDSTCATILLETPSRIIGILGVEKICYPIDTNLFEELFEEAKIRYLIYIDKTRVHIYTKINNSIKEISDLPSVDLKEENVVDARMLEEVISNIKLKRTHSADYVGDVFALAVQIYREDIWDEIKTARDLRVVTDIKNQIDRAYPHVISNNFEKYDSEYLINDILSFEKVKFNNIVTGAAETYCQLLSDHYDHGSKQLIELMMRLAVGETAISTSVQGRFIINVSRTNRIVDFYGITSIQNTQRLRFICQDKNNFFNGWLIENKKYDSIVMLPPFGMEWHEEELTDERSHLHSRMDLESKLIKDAISHLNDRGRLIIAIPAKMLFSLKNKLIRDFLKENYSISSIIELDQIFDNTVIKGYLVIIEKKPIKNCMISINPVKKNDLYCLGNAVNTFLNESIIDGTNFRLVPQSEFNDIWLPNRIDMRIIRQQEEEYMWGTPLAECCEIIRGCFIPSNKYFEAGAIGGIPLLRISNIQNNMIDLTDCVRVPAECAKVLSKKGDLIFSVTGTIGKKAFVNDEFVPGPQVVLLRCREGFSSEKIMNALNTPEVKEQITMNIAGSTVKNLPKDSLLKLRLRV